MGRKWLIAIAVIALLLVGLFVMGYISIPDDNDSNMEIIFYDEDGNELGRSDSKLGILGVQSPSFTGDIYSLDVVVYFQVTTDIDYASITTGCYLTITTRLDMERADILHQITEHRLGAYNSDESGTFSANYLMSTLLPDSKIDNDGRNFGWAMYFEARVHTSLIKGGDIVEVEDSCGTTLKLAWVADTLKLESWFGDW